MKKSLNLFLIFIVLFFLGGCSDKKEMLRITPFACEVRILNDKSISEGIFVYENDDSMHLELTSGAEVNGLRISYADGRCNYSSDDIGITLPEDADSQQVYGLFSALRLLDASQVEILKNKENVFGLINNNEEYTYTVDGESGRLLRVSSIHGEIIFRYQD